MSTSMLRRQLKNIVQNFSEAEIKVREATSNDPWGPSSSLMCEISDLTYNVVALSEIMNMLWKRLSDHGKNWRHVYKALTLLECLVKTGSDRVAQQCQENISVIQYLTEFQYIDKDSKDQGVNVREKAKQLMVLLTDAAKLQEERNHALKTKEKMAKSANTSSATPAPAPVAGPIDMDRVLGGVAALQLEMARKKEMAAQSSAIEKGTVDTQEGDGPPKSPPASNDPWGGDGTSTAPPASNDPWGGDETSTAPPASNDPWGGDETSTATPASSDLWGGEETSSTAPASNDPWGGKETSSAPPANNDPWGGKETSSSPPASNDPWGDKETSSSPPASNDPWGDKETSSSPPASNDPWGDKETSSSPPASNDPWGGEDTSSSPPASNDPWGGNGTSTAHPADSDPWRGDSTTGEASSDPWGSSGDPDHSKITTGGGCGGTSTESVHTATPIAVSPPLPVSKTPESFLGPDAVDLDSQVSSKSAQPISTPVSLSSVQNPTLESKSKEG